jgi:hypothetical protein
VPERLNGHDWKSCVGYNPPRVRIPPSPLAGCTVGAGPRLLALLRMDDDQPITIEALTVLLVDAVRTDGEARELTDRDVGRAAKRRYRRLGTISLPTGPLGRYLVGLYCEAATLCDIVELRRAPLSDETPAS